MIEKRIIQKNKKLILGTKIRVGQKTFEFEGCGPIAIKLTTRISGADTQKSSLAQLWVRYENINPIIEKELITALKKAGVEL